MARFTFSGLDEIIDRMDKAGRLADTALVDEMLNAGAKEVQKVWKEVAEEKGYDFSGEMIRHITFSKRPVSVNEARAIEIYPKGKDKKTGVRNAEKAFHLHYGTSKIPASHWVDEVRARAQEPALRAMTAVFENAQK